MIAVVLVGASWGADPAFAEPPVPMWGVDLPGARLNSATHAERSRPVIAGDSVFVGSAGGRAVYELRRADGSLRRTFPATASVEGAPLVTDDRLYFSDSAGSTWCYLRVDGTPCWNEEHRGTAPVLSRPTLAGNRLIVADVDDLVVALDVADGSLAWRFRPKTSPSRSGELTLYATPSPVLDGGSVLVGFSDGTVTALTVDAGEEDWSRRVGEGRYPDIVGEPVRWGGDWFVSGYWLPLVAIDASSHAVRWRVDARSAAPVTVLGRGAAATVLQPGTDGVLRAIAALTGAERWRWESGDGGALTEVVPTEAGLLVGSSAGALALVDPETGHTRWNWHGDVLLTGLSAAPTVDGDQLVFVTNAGRIYGMVSP